jgi:hypothetical protein
MTDDYGQFMAAARAAIHVYTRRSLNQLRALNDGHRYLGGNREKDRFVPTALVAMSECH